MYCFLCHEVHKCKCLLEYNYATLKIFKYIFTLSILDVLECSEIVLVFV